MLKKVIDKNIDDKVKQLANLKSGERGIIREIKGSKNVVQRLVDMGLTSGSEVLLTKALYHGPVEISVRGSRLVIGKDIAMKIFVESK